MGGWYTNIVQFKDTIAKYIFLQSTLQCDYFKPPNNKIEPYWFDYLGKLIFIIMDFPIYSNRVTLGSLSEYGH